MGGYPSCTTTPGSKKSAAVRPTEPISEVVERVDQSFRVGGVEEHPDIEILRRSRMTVSGNCVTAGDQEPDLTPDAALDALDGVLSEESHLSIPN